MIKATERTMHRLQFETLRQGRTHVTKILRLRLSDLVEAEGALRLTNLKPRGRDQRLRLVYVSPDLLSRLHALATEARLGANAFFSRSRQSGPNP